MPPPPVFAGTCPGPVGTLTCSHSSSLHVASSLDLRAEGDLPLCLVPQGILLQVLGGVQVERTLRRLLPGSSGPNSTPISLPGEVLQMSQLQIQSWLLILACLFPVAIWFRHPWPFAGLGSWLLDGPGP